MAPHRLRCLSPQLQLQFHLGHEPDDDDRHDVAWLCHHFGLRERSMTRKAARGTYQCGEIVSAGDAAIMVRFQSAISQSTHARVMALLRALDRNPPAGVRDLVPAYASLLMLFDPLITSHAGIEAHVRSVLGMMRVRTNVGEGRLVRIPVEYGGAAGPDLEEVAHLVGLSPEEVVRRHVEAEYRVNFLGFLAGFPYLSGLPTELAVPRLPSPRTHVPAGSVGLAGQQTGIYPVVTPGGWRIIGQTPARLFDPRRHPPSLLRPGDRVRFEPVGDRHVSGAQKSGSQSPDRGINMPHVTRTRERVDTAKTTKAMEPDPDAVPWMSVRVPGPLATVQDLGRTGYGRYGVSASGAADADALQLGNLLLGNPRGAAALELTLGGGEFEVLAPCVVAVTGADCALFHNGRQVPTGVAMALESTDTLQIGWARHGARCYVCVSGGVRTTPVLGSSATDVRAGLGGVEGRALCANDVLWRGISRQPVDALAGRKVSADTARYLNTTGVRTIRILAGQHAKEAAEDLEALLANTYVVSPRSDRVGVRLQPVGLSGEREAIGGETISEGVPRGAVQVPPTGEPIILLADHQTTGGYCVPAVVATDDLWRVAQLRPGNTLRFALVTVEAAVEALRVRAARLERLALHEARSSRLMSTGHALPDIALLMRGFPEWSDEEGDDGE